MYTKYNLCFIIYTSFLNHIGSKRITPVLQRNKSNLKTSTNRSVLSKRTTWSTYL